MPAWVTPADFTAGQILTAAQMDNISNDLNYLYNVAHVTSGGRVPAGLWSTTSATFTDWNGATPLEVSHTKRGGTETQLRVDIHMSGYYTGSASVPQIAVRIGSTDYTNSYPHTFSAINVHQAISEVMLVSALAAATYTLKLRVLTAAGTFCADGNNFAELVVSEVVNG